MSQTASPVAQSSVRKQVVAERDGLKVVRLSVAAGAGVPTHSSNVDVVAVVVQGTGTFTVEGKPRAIAPGSVIDMRPNQSHSIDAKQDLELVVLHSRLGGGSAAVTCSA